MVLCYGQHAFQCMVAQFQSVIFGIEQYVGCRCRFGNEPYRLAATYAFRQMVYVCNVALGSQGILCGLSLLFVGPGNKAVYVCLHFCVVLCKYTNKRVKKYQARLNIFSQRA